ncbi:BQ2448_3005 [Microbotryum intermedium]|uniref:BQ2448_3005 protein n=1 Tax=Microbotryum intermedium TaxID=269621 RepID=A0A238FDY2_9BASI|nr:BQ2448_3005 [Microbotryum intermedium]
MSNDKNIFTAYDKSTYINKHTQPQPGMDENMSPLAVHTQVERWTREGEPYLEEYKGSSKLDGKAAIITGGDSGIGRTVAIFFAREGADVTISYLKEEEQDAQKTKSLVEETGRTALLVPGDLRQHSDRAELIKKHLDKFKYLDILVNNASKQFQCQDIANIEMEKVEDTFQTNIVQMIGLCKEAVPKMKCGSTIINTSSVGLYQGNPILVDYTATKGAIAAFTRSLASQLLSKGIRVNSVAPGPVYTPLQAASMPPEQMENMGVEEVPLYGRIAQPAELGESYVYLATSNLSTGTILHPNSGKYFIP